MAANFPVCGMSYLGEAPLLGIVDRPIKHWSALDGLILAVPHRMLGSDGWERLFAAPA
jgi:hypothetical protein